MLILYGLHVVLTDLVLQLLEPIIAMSSASKRTSRLDGSRLKRQALQRR